MGEGHTEGVHPKSRGIPWVASGDVACHALVETELAEESEPSGKALLAVEPFGLDVLVGATGGIGEQG